MAKEINLSVNNNIKIWLLSLPCWFCISNELMQKANVKQNSI